MIQPADRREVLGISGKDSLSAARLVKAPKP